MSQTVDISGLSQKRLALLGNPNCGKSALFNRLTGSKQKVANYAGVTVELKRGRTRTPKGHAITVVDLPGTYSLQAGSEDEAVACQVVLGQSLQEPRPTLVAVVLDATRLRRGLRLVAALQRWHVPCIVVLNMMDRVRSWPHPPSAPQLQQVLGIPVVEAAGIHAQGAQALLALLDDDKVWQQQAVESPQGPGPQTADAHLQDDAQAQRWMQAAGLDMQPQRHLLSEKLDAWLLNPFVGSAVLVTVLFLIFQAVFAWAQWPMEQIEGLTQLAGQGLDSHVPEGLFKSLLVDGVVAGVGSVLVFLPQILILFLFILLLDESGYLPRAALLLDRMMGSVGLSGRAFIPLLSSFACAIPGVMATRTIADKRDRWLTIAIAPLMTCSARLPVYALLIGAFIPARDVLGMNLQGLVLLGLYMLGIVSAVAVAAIAKLWRPQGQKPQLMMELPDYHWPRIKDVALGLWQRAWIFLRNVGGIILALNVVLWFLATFPQAPVDHVGPAIEFSLAGRIGKALAVVFEPIGFNWQIAIALIPGLAAREVAVGALGTVYALSQTGDDVGTALAPLIAQSWSLATGMSLLIWYVYAPQCLATLAVVRKEVGQTKLPLIMLTYLFGLAYLASWVTYRLVGAMA